MSQVISPPHETDQFEEIDYGDPTKGAEEPFEPLELDKVCPTDYGAFVMSAIGRMRKSNLPVEAPSSPPGSPGSSQPPQPPPSIDQDILRQCLRLASSFLITDSTMNPGTGLTTWSTGLGRLVDIVLALHTTGALEVETLSEASKACTECWYATLAFPGIENARARIRDDGLRLKKLLDGPDNKSYKGTPLSV